MIIIFIVVCVEVNDEVEREREGQVIIQVDW